MAKGRTKKQRERERERKQERKSKSKTEMKMKVKRNTDRRRKDNYFLGATKHTARRAAAIVFVSTAIDTAASLMEVGGEVIGFVLPPVI